MRRCHRFTTFSATAILMALALSLLLAPGAARAESREETAAQERLDAERAAHIRAKQWDQFLTVLKAKDTAALKPWVRLPISVGDKKLETLQDFTAIMRSPRVLRGINRAQIIATETGFTAQWKGDGAAKYSRYALIFNRSESNEDQYQVTQWSKWAQNY